MATIEERLRLAEATLKKNGFTKLDDIWVAPAKPTTADTERMDWLDQNIFHAEMDDLDKKIYKDCWAWRTFAPVGVQGTARRIVDAAMTAHKKGPKP